MTRTDASMDELDAAIRREAGVLRERVGSAADIELAWDRFEVGRGEIAVPKHPRNNGTRWVVAVATGMVAAVLVALVLVARAGPPTERTVDTTPSLPIPDVSAPPATTTPTVPDPTTPITVVVDSVPAPSLEPSPTKAPQASPTSVLVAPPAGTDGAISPVVAVESELAMPSIVFTADGRQLVMSQGEHLVVVDAATGGTVNRLTVGGPGLIAASGTRFFDGQAVWDLETGAEVARIDGSSGSVSLKALSPDGRTAAVWVGSRGGSPVVNVYDAETGRQMYELVTEKSQDLHGLSFSPDGTTLLTIAGEGLMSQVWDVATGELMFGMSPMDPTAYTADGRYIVVGNWAWHVYDAATGDRLATHPASVWFSPTSSFETLSASGTRMVIGLQRPDQTWTVAVYDTVTGETMANLEFGTLGLFVPAQAINADGSRFVTGGDGLMTVWDLTTGVAIATLAAPTGTISAVAFSPDGSTIAAVMSDGNLYIWPAP